MRKFIADKDIYGNNTGVYREVEESSAGSFPALLFIWGIALIPLIIALSPIWYFVTKAKLKDMSPRAKNYKLLYTLNKITKGVSIFQVSMVAIGLIFGVVILGGHLLGIFNFIDFEGFLFS